MFIELSGQRESTRRLCMIRLFKELELCWEQLLYENRQIIAGISKELRSTVLLAWVQTELRRKLPKKRTRPKDGRNQSLTLPVFRYSLCLVLHVF